MPYEWNNKIVVTREELVPAFYSSWRALRGQLDRYKEKPYGIKRARQGKGLGNCVLIDFDTLPSDIQAALGDPRRLNHILEKFYKPDPAAITFYTNEKAGGKGLAPDKQEEYIINAQVLNAAIALRDARIDEHLKRTGRRPKKLEDTVCDDVKSFNPVLKSKFGVCHTLPGNPRRLMDKIRNYEREGYGSLITGAFGNTNAAKKTEKTIYLLESMFARDKVKPNPTDVARRYDAFLGGYVELFDAATGEQFNPKDYKRLSERTITRFLSSWESKVATYKQRTGERQQYMSEFESWVSTGHVKWAGSLLSIDDRQPPFEYEKGKRMWFYLGIDLGSEAFTCWVWGKDKEGIILDFYREMVRNYAEWGLSLPAELECESNLNANFRKTFLREGRMFDYVRVEANNARGKRIEQYFRSLRYDFEREEENWIGRPFARNEANQSRPDKKTVEYNALVRQCLKTIQDWNNHEHSQHKGKTRWEVFLEKQNPDLRPINWKGILPYLGYVTRATCRSGNVKFHDTLFLLGDNGKIALGDELIELMKVVERQELQIYWLDGHDGGVLKAIAYIDNKYVCELIKKPIVARARIEQTAGDRANMELVSHYNNTIRAYATRRKNALTDVVMIDHRRRTLNDNFKIPFLETGAEQYQPMELEILNNDFEEPLKRDLKRTAKTVKEQMMENWLGL